MRALASVTMGIRNMPWDEWIELDRDFALTHRVCDYRVQTLGEKLVQMHPAQPGVVESGHAAGRRKCGEGSAVAVGGGVVEE